jgi:hypothetical protein
MKFAFCVPAAIALALSNTPVALAQTATEEFVWPSASTGSDSKLTLDIDRKEDQKPGAPFPIPEGLEYEIVPTIPETPETPDTPEIPDQNPDPEPANSNEFVPRQDLNRDPTENREITGNYVDSDDTGATARPVQTSDRVSELPNEKESDPEEEPANRLSFGMTVIPSGEPTTEEPEAPASTEEPAAEAVAQTPAPTETETAVAEVEDPVSEAVVETPAPAKAETVTPAPTKAKTVTLAPAKADAIVEAPEAEKTEPVATPAVLHTTDATTVQASDTTATPKTADPTQLSAIIATLAAGAGLAGCGWKLNRKQR